MQAALFYYLSWCYILGASIYVNILDKRLTLDALANFFWSTVYT